MLKKLFVSVLTIILLLPAAVSFGATAASQNLTVTGQGFAPSSPVTVKSHDGSSFTTTANGSGAVAFNVSISDAANGVYPVRAEGRSAVNNDSLVLSGNFAVKGTKVENTGTLGNGGTQPVEPYAKVYEGPLQAKLVKVMGARIIPVKKSSSAEELPMTGGSTLWLLLAGGLVLATGGFALKVRIKD